METSAAAPSLGFDYFHGFLALMELILKRLSLGPFNNHVFLIASTY